MRYIPFLVIAALVPGGLVLALFLQANWSAPLTSAGSSRLGADGCNIARGFMFALGCIQVQACHSGKCPTGVTTQDARRYRALAVDGTRLKAVNNKDRNFTRSTLVKFIAEADERLTAYMKRLDAGDAEEERVGYGAHDQRWAWAIMGRRCTRIYRHSDSSDL